MTRITDQLKDFPLMEGIGLFLGLCALDFLIFGYLHFAHTSLTALVCALVVFALRCWKNAKNPPEKESKPRQSE